MIRKNSPSYFLLLGLEKLIETEINFVDFAYNSHKLMYGFPRELSYGDLYQAIKTLRKNGFIESNKNEGRIILKLTDRGRQEALIRKLIGVEEWDGKWRIVIFDIPEKHRQLRNVLRSKLKEWEFVPWQKSVWAGKKNVARELREVVKEIGLSDWVKIVVSGDVD